MSKKNYHYPLDMRWTHEEIEKVINFLVQIERVYEQGADYLDVLTTYQGFKEVVPSKGEERQIDREFEALSHYSTYRAVRAAKELAERDRELNVSPLKKKRRLKLERGS